MQYLTKGTLIFENLYLGDFIGLQGATGVITCPSTANQQCRLPETTFRGKMLKLHAKKLVVEEVMP